MIKVNNLNKFYNKGKANQIHVINETSIELPSKGLITFLGHSGSGKTTLLNVIGGLDKQTTGSIVYDDVEFKKYSMSRVDKYRSRHIGYVFQNYNLLLEETVYDNLRIALDLIGITDLEEQKKRIEYALKAVGMFKYRKKVASFLSGGQQQRVSIARALVKKTKVIIADEPTGNLDSKNTMEVMNILKKISEQSLVLLVTHETNVANFYSDLIYEIKDGKIIDKKEINTDVTFDSSRDDSVVYLKDLNENEYKTELGDITIHSDTEEPLKINFDIIVKNGNVYLKSDKPIKLVEQADLRIINDHYKEIKREDITSFNYDTSWYNDNKEEPKRFKKIFTRLKNSFISFKSVGRKQKFLYICLGFIGAIMAIAFSILSNAITFDISGTSYSSKINSIIRDKNYSSNSVYNCFYEGYYNNEISDVYCLRPTMGVYSEAVVYNYNVEESSYVMIAPYLDYNVDLLYGEKPVLKDEIVISSDLADKICKTARCEYADLMGKNFNYYDSTNCRIVGISKNDNKMVYLSKNNYELYISQVYSVGYDVYISVNSLNESWYKNVNDYYIIGDSKFECKYNLKDYTYEKYKVISGRDIDPNATEMECLVSKDFYLSNEKYIATDIGNINIVGVYDGDFASQYRVLMNKGVKKVDNGYTPLSAVFENSTNVQLIEGEYPKKENEVIIPNSINYNVSVGDTISLSGYGAVKVVGKFTGADDLDESILSTLSFYTLTNSISYDTISFNVINQSGFNSRISNQGISIISHKDRAILSAQTDKANSVKTFFYVFSITTIATAVFIYFVMRSKMLSDIYNIGVYRSLGASRGRINRKYLSDIFVLSTLTCFIGYVIGTVLYVAISSAVNSTFGSIGQSNVLMVNGWIMVLGAFVLYLMMNIFGMMPIVMLENKTPSEIIAKYDI